MKFSVALLLLVGNAHAFLSQNPTFFGVRSNRALSSTTLEDIKVDTNTPVTQSPTSVRAPLKWLGPYPSLGLRFPDLATSSQRERNVTGVSLDFVLDTAANTNTINAQVSAELGLEVVGQALSGVGASGAIPGGNTYMLGDCQLEGLSNNEEPFTFMTDLTASTLAVASPVSAGLLSLAFLQCFPGGVEFVWGRVEDGEIKEIPSVTFHSDDARSFESLQRSPITRIPITQLPSVMIKVNGVEMPALLDTGSPITVLNAQAAAAAGIKTVDLPSMDEQKNPFSKLAASFKVAQAASRGEMLQLADGSGQPVNLVKSLQLAK
ncbi:Aspartyl protease [Fragilaria crotonensis]|nr:Aspartyl protease [Fragilaria crotonensis]